MGSFRGIVIGPPESVDQTIGETCTKIARKDRIKNTLEYGEISTDDCREILNYRDNHDTYPFLYLFDSREELLEYLDQLENEGYNLISGTGFWFICYHYSPEEHLEQYSDPLVRYVVRKDGGRSDSPFSYDPRQDFVTEL